MPSILSSGIVSFPEEKELLEEKDATIKKIYIFYVCRKTDNLLKNKFLIKLSLLIKILQILQIIKYLLIFAVNCNNWRSEIKSRGYNINFKVMWDVLETLTLYTQS